MRVSEWDQEGSSCLRGVLIPPAHADGTDLAPLPPALSGGTDSVTSPRLIGNSALPYNLPEHANVSGVRFNHE